MMIQSSSETTASTSPISPFSSFSVPSEPTSDEQPDLGAFVNVFHAWNQLQPTRTFTHRPQYSTSVSTSSESIMELESDDASGSLLVGSTVWTHGPIASYLNSISAATSTDRRSPSPGSGSNTEGAAELDESGVPMEFELSDLEDLDLEQPSLGLLDDALSFLASERARWTARREADVGGNDGPWKHAGEPRRKRRRKRTRNIKSEGASRDELAAEGELLAAEDADDSSSSYDYTTTTTTTTSTNPKSVPPTPARSRRERRKQQQALTVSPGRVLVHSKSTPQLRVLPQVYESHPHPARLTQLRVLVKKLAKAFPADAASLDRLIPSDAELPHRLRMDGDHVFIDPRGPPSGEKDILTHVFIDHSNILIGLLTHLKRNPRTLPQNASSAASSSHATTHIATPMPTMMTFPPSKPHSKSRHLSHTALALVLERGRAISRRVLVASSPLYQPMESAERLGYEVRVYARVPDLGDGQDRHGPRHGHTRSLSGGIITSASGDSGGSRRGKKHIRRTSAESTSNESEQGNLQAFPQAFVRSLGLSGGVMLSSSPPRHTPPAVSASVPSNGLAGLHAYSSSPGAGKIKYREQGVDELLQLKLHQALAAIDGPPPPGSTIVLATGDGNIGQFNEDGFIGPVRTALKKGWRVELYAWEDGLSRVWMREFSEWTQPVGPEPTGRFRVIGLEQFAGDLLEIY